MASRDDARVYGEGGGWRCVYFRMCTSTFPPSTVGNVGQQVPASLVQQVLQEAGDLLSFSCVPCAARREHRAWQPLLVPCSTQLETGSLGLLQSTQGVRHGRV